MTQILYLAEILGMAFLAGFMHTRLRTIGASSRDEADTPLRRAWDRVTYSLPQRWTVMLGVPLVLISAVVHGEVATQLRLGAGVLLGAHFLSIGLATGLQRDGRRIVVLASRDAQLPKDGK